MPSLLHPKMYVFFLVLYARLLNNVFIAIFPSQASNLLMAALCLVNELDYGSLEVLSMAVRNRLDEFDSN